MIEAVVFDLGAVILFHKDKTNKEKLSPLYKKLKRQNNFQFEDYDLMVLDKPAGWVVNNAESVKGETVQEWISKNFQFPISNFQLLRNGVVHRLDKETSGVL